MSNNCYWIILKNVENLRFQKCSSVFIIFKGLGVKERRRQNTSLAKSYIYADNANF